jgi:hypothetical protein
MGGRKLELSRPNELACVLIDVIRGPQWVLSCVLMQAITRASHCPMIFIRKLIIFIWGASKWSSTSSSLGCIFITTPTRSYKKRYRDYARHTQKYLFRACGDASFPLVCVAPRSRCACTQMIPKWFVQGMFAINFLHHSLLHSLSTISCFEVDHANGLPSNLVWKRCNFIWVNQEHKR